MMQNDEELGLYNEWDTTLMDGLENEPFEVDVISTDEKEPEIKTVYVEKPVEVIKEVIKEVPVEVIKEVPVTGIIDTVNQSTATIDDKKRKGPLYAYRTNRSPEDDKNLTQSTD